MKSYLQRIVWAAICLAGWVSAASADDISVQGSAIAKKYCYNCHGTTYNGDASLNVLDREALLNPDHGYVVEGNLDESYLWQRVSDNEMPPKGQPQPSPEEREVLRQWILSGAPMPQRVRREFIQWETILTAISDDLQESAPETRPFYRYFTLTHLYNNVEGVTELDMRLYRAALAKSLNSVCWKPDLVMPHPLDEAQTVFRVDLRHLGWTNDQWRMMLRHYPYGMRFQNVADERIAKLDRDIGLYTDTPLCYMRADWFVARCMRPPIYNNLLELPATAHDLEKLLQVDVIADFNQDQLRRAGFVESGVSAGNRVVDRHASVHGYYWKSYDFRKGGEFNNIMKFPLGPDYPGHPFESLAFHPDGGEMIFSLPNGLQGYMLVKEDGARLDEGPIDVVRDLTETSGAPLIVNGLSCMSCHRHGMIEFKDTVREGAGALGEARRKVRNLYPDPEEMKQLVSRDQKRFLRALEDVTGPFLQVGDDAEKPIDAFPEPVGAIARKFEQRLGLSEVAAEVHIEDESLLKGAIQANPRLRSELGLGPLVNGERISRTNWETRDQVLSPAQVLMQTLDVGTPLLIFDE
jgi:serine/threonine-protein kinase